MDKFKVGNARFVDSKKKSYRYMAVFHSGMGAFSTLITVGSMIMGAYMMKDGELTTADQVTFLM